MPHERTGDEVLDTTSANFVKHDAPAGLVVFLEALPGFMGIALGSGAPIFAGIIAGNADGFVVSVFFGSQVSVSEAAARLDCDRPDGDPVNIGSYEGCLAARVLLGVVQLVFGILRFGVVGDKRAEFGHQATVCCSLPKRAVSPTRTNCPGDCANCRRTRSWRRRVRPRRSSITTPWKCRTVRQLAPFRNIQIELKHRGKSKANTHLVIES